MKDYLRSINQNNEKFRRYKWEDHRKQVTRVFEEVLVEREQVVHCSKKNVVFSFLLHLAEDTQDAHNATNISFSHPEMQATNVNEGILEAFMLGNSTKEELVDKLLLVDDVYRSLTLVPGQKC